MWSWYASGNTGYRRGITISLDGGATWESATVTGATWDHTSDLTDRSISKRVMTRARSGDRVQAPVAEQYLNIYSYQTFVPSAQK